MNLNQAISELWHVSRTALAGQATVPSKYDRMIYVKKSLKEHYPALIEGMMSKHVWFAIEEFVYG